MSQPPISAREPSVTNLPAALISTVTALPAAANKMPNLQVGRHTRQGTNVIVESGVYKAPSGVFTPDKSNTYPESSLALQGKKTSSVKITVKDNDK